jgi:hypothetical protein
VLQNRLKNGTTLFFGHPNYGLTKLPTAKMSTLKLPTAKISTHPNDPQKNVNIQITKHKMSKSKLLNAKMTTQPNDRQKNVDRHHLTTTKLT